MTEWQLPGTVFSVKLNQGELLLLDWFLCGASRLLPDCELGYLITTWHMTRMEIWKALQAIDMQGNDPMPQQFPLDEATAKVVLAICPTTFRWGTGEDCGYSLKTKVARFLRGESNVDDTASGAIPGQDKAPGATPDDSYD